MIDATNITLQFPRPEGLIDYYSVEYKLLIPTQQTDVNETTTSINWITESAYWNMQSFNASFNGRKNFTDFGYPNEGSVINLGLDDLISGAGYKLTIRTSSNSMFSDPVNLEAHTSELSIIIIEGREQKCGRLPKIIIYLQ